VANKKTENNSTNSNASATTAGTSFTREEGQSLFTTLTESFTEDLKSQTAQQNKTIADLIANQLKRDEAHQTYQAEQRKAEAAVRKEQADECKEQTSQIAQLLTLFAQTNISQQPGPQPPKQSTASRRRHHRQTKVTHKDIQHTKQTATDNPEAPMNTSPASTIPKRSKDTDSIESTPNQDSKPANQERRTAKEWAAHLAGHVYPSSSGSPDSS
jgi:hypothetical protein